MDDFSLSWKKEGGKGRREGGEGEREGGREGGRKGEVRRVTTREDE